MISQTTGKLSTFKPSKSIINQLVRQFSSSSDNNPADHSRIHYVGEICRKYRLRTDELRRPEHHSFKVTRTDREPSYYDKIRTDADCPRVIYLADAGVISKAKEYANGMLKNWLVRGIGLNDTKDEFLENGRDVLFFEILRALVEQDFTNLSEFTLGGMKTLQFHRNAASRLTELQREALKLTKDDLMGDNGYIMKWPVLGVNELSHYIHDLTYVHLDATDNIHFVDEEKTKPKIFLRYKVAMGAIYKFESLRKEIDKTGDLWNMPFRVPKSYKFDCPRFTFVEMDICQQVTVPKTFPLKLYPQRYLYDFHVFTF